MNRCAWCGEHTDPDFDICDGDAWWHEDCLKEAQAEQAEDERLDDPRHEPK